MLPKPAEDAPPEDEDDDGAEWFALAARTGPRCMAIRPPWRGRSDVDAERNNLSSWPLDCPRF